MSKILNYIQRLNSTGFLGAYNMGVWGVSVSHGPSYQDGLSASGTATTTILATSLTKIDTQNYVKFYDTPNLWGYLDKITRNRSEDSNFCPDPQNPSTSHALYSKSWGARRFIDNEIKKKQAWQNLVERWKTVIGQSTRLVDITSLSPPEEGHEVHAAILEGITTCITNWTKSAKDEQGNPPKLMIRILFGNTIANVPGMKTKWNQFYYDLEKVLTDPALQEFIKGINEKPVVLYGSDVGHTGTKTKPLSIMSSFNHSKIVAGDGHYAIVGGHNMCEEVSSKEYPVIHDITSEVTGPGARTANTFAGSLWLKAAESGRLTIYRFNWGTKKFDDLSRSSAKRWAPNNNVYYSTGTQKEVPNVIRDQYWYYNMQDLDAITNKQAAPNGSVAATVIMGIGRWGDVNVFGTKGEGLKRGKDIDRNINACQYASDLLKRAMIIDQTNWYIRMSQQDLVNDGKFGKFQASEHTICERLAWRLHANPLCVAIQIVVSARFSQNMEGLAYSYGDGPREAIERISNNLHGLAPVNRSMLSSMFNTPEHLKILDLSNGLGRADFISPDRFDTKDPLSYCTVAPLAFCDTEYANRTRGSYVWIDSEYKPESLFANQRFFDKKNDKKFGPGNHAKVMFVSDVNDADDTAVVMIGSDNMYPSPLAEFSFIIEGAEAIKQFREQYWNKLWKYSEPLGFKVDSEGTIT